MLHMEDIRWGDAWLWWILLLPLVLVPVYVWYWRFRSRVEGGFSGHGLVSKMVVRRSRGRLLASAVCAFIALELLGVAALRPKYGLRDVTVKGIGVDVCIVLDASRSMKASDIAPDRLTASSVEINRLLDSMKGNRVALVPFAGLSFIQTPLTLDYLVLKAYLKELRVTDIPVPGTALGRALKTAVSALGIDGEEAGDTHKVIIVFTDGENHEGDPAEVAADMAGGNVRIFTVGVGTPSGQPVPVLDEDGGVTGTAREEDGVTPVLSRLNEELLKTLAARTGGKYFALTGIGDVSQQLHRELEAIEKAEYQARLERLLEDRFQYPLGAAIALMALTLLLLGGGRRSGGAATAMVLAMLCSSNAYAQQVFRMDHGGVNDAIEMLNEGRSGDAAKALSELADELPGRPDLLYDLGLARDAAGDFDEAVTALDEAIGILDRRKEPGADRPSRGRLLHARGTVLAHKALQMDKEDADPVEVRAIWRKAVKSLTTALMLDPGDPDTRRNLELAAMAAYPPCSRLDDSYEPNDSAMDAKFLQPDPDTLVVKEHLLLCPGNKDFFKLPVRTGETLFAGVQKPGQEDAANEKGGRIEPARVGLTLEDPVGNELSTVSKQARFSPNESVTVLLKIDGPEEEDGIPYLLSANIVPPCPAGDDQMEDNDDKGNSKPLTDGEHQLRICPADDDWFEYVEKEGTQKQVTLQVPAGEGPLEIDVFSADGAPVDVEKETGEQGTMIAALLPKAENEAPFHVRIYGGSGEGFYTLAIKDPSGGNGDEQPQSDQEQKQEQEPEQQQQQEKEKEDDEKGSRTMRELLESIDNNEENLEAEEASRNFPYREYVPEKDW